ncbi:oligosaccharyl transferase, archaeosortase A system-associated [Methanoregula sp.]|uniref:oligosaccharyl transferase, archaeosortase A system-associated n=1 Tax=Methanoregula sp. TaxID=2052170 RepID=UPI00356172C2
MDFSALQKYQSYIIAGILAAFVIFALWIRLLPMLTMGNMDVINFVAMDDPFYNLRQTEQMLAHFPQYGWFDAMTLYPTGTVNYWGPLFPLILSVCCLITGAATRPEIISTALLVPPLMAAATIVVMYFTGKCFGDWKTGLLAAGFTAIVSGQFFYRSFYGYLDHHIAEVLFSTLFCLLYSYAILSDKDNTIDLHQIASYKRTIVLAFLAGIAYLAGLFVMPTMILFALIVGIFTVIQAVVDVCRNRSSGYLVLINTVVFATAAIGLFLFGFSSASLGLSTYSLGHILVYAGLIAGTLVLYFLAQYLKGKNPALYLGSILGIAVAIVLVIALATPDIFNILMSNLSAFFGQQAVTNTVLEAMGWSVGSAWMAFNYGLLLFAGGVLVMLYQNVRNEHPHQVFALVWSVVMFYSTWQHVRYEYYLGINIALLAAVCVSFVISRSEKEVCGFLKGSDSAKPAAEPDLPEPTIRKPGKSSKKPAKKAARVKSPDYLVLLPVFLTVAIAILFVFNSASYSYLLSSSRGIALSPDWKESLEWMGQNTPDPGVDYLAVYDKDTFTYPETAYGVMSWWDYGHMITYIAKRIPNANPFQQGVAGPNGAAAFFVATDEGVANAILDADGTRYVVTDYMMDWSKFGPMATWYNSTAGLDPYMIDVLVPDQNRLSNTATLAILNKPLYYQSMVSRLHNFDGSMTPAGNTSFYVELADPVITGTSVPVIMNAQTMNITDALIRVKEYNLKAPAGYHAAVLSTSTTHPIGDVSALRHYRLVHESPNNAPDSNTLNHKSVKVFEYVKGAHISGTGTIEVPLVTNTGRNYVYRQESTNGEFIVPYSTTGNPYGVKATGKYRVLSTGREYEVPETAVMQGLTIS